MEQWKEIEEFPYYVVSTDGRVCSLPRMIIRRDGQRQGVGGGILSPVARNNKGVHYGEVTLSNTEAHTRAIRKVHHLVLETFVGERPDGMVTRHLNGDSLDNRLENLAYGTHEQNVTDRSRQGKTHRPIGELNGRSKLCARDVRAIRRHVRDGVRRMALANAYDVSLSLINQIVSGRVWASTPKE